MKKRTFIKIGLAAFSAGLVDIYIAPMPVAELFASSELKRIRTLHPGDQIPQLFRAKVKIQELRSGEQAGFRILNLQWQRPFWCGAVVRHRYAVCSFEVGCPQDVGKLYEITGYRLPPGVSIPNGELLCPVPGEVFYKPALHERV
jgi:hypothetical protein